MDNQKVIQTAKLLAEFEPGFLPYPVFEQIARLVALPVVEFIPLRYKNNSVEILLIPRTEKDPYWSGMVHTPGTVIRATDLNSSGNFPAFSRIIGEELNNTDVGPPHYVGSLLNSSKRGVEQAQLYWVEVLGEPKIGSFYSFDNLPSNLISSQDKFIKQAVKNFLEFKL